MNERYEGEERRQPERWRLSKEVSVTDLVGLAMAFAAVLFAYTNLDKRTDGLERMVTVQATTDARQDAEAQRYQSRIDSTLVSINNKLDRLIEDKYSSTRQDRR